MAVDHALHVFKRAQRGLFAGKTRLVGNSISASKRHTKRAWVPNVQRKRLFSATLGRQLTVNVTTTALRTIDRFGGLDEYVLGSTPTKLASEKGESLRLQMAAALGVAPAVKSPAMPRSRMSSPPTMFVPRAREKLMRLYAHGDGWKW